MEHYIDKNIPIPPRNPRRGGAGTPPVPYNKYPLADMEVGDSFLCTNRTATQLGCNLTTYAARQPDPKPKFTLRQLPEGVRVWRIS